MHHKKSDPEQSDGIKKAANQWRPTKYIRVPIQYHFIQIQPVSNVSIAPRMLLYQQFDVIQAVRLQLEIRRTG